MTAVSVAEPATEGDGNLTAARQAWSASLGRLQTIAEATGCLVEVRGLGLFFGAEVAGDDAGDAARRAETILYAALERGLSRRYFFTSWMGWPSGTCFIAAEFMQ